MTRRSLRRALAVPVTASAFAFACAMLPARVPAALKAGAWMRVYGTIVRVDVRRGTLLLRHGPLDTAPSGTERCRLANREGLRRLRPGDRVRALAETDRHPWLLTDAELIL